MDIIGRSLSAAAVIAVIIFLRRIMFRKIPKRVLSALWLIAAAKLLLPSMGIAVTEGFAADTVVTETVYPVHDIVSAIPEAVINVAVPVSESNLFVSLCDTYGSSERYLQARFLPFIILKAEGSFPVLFPQTITLNR